MSDIVIEMKLDTGDLARVDRVLNGLANNLNARSAREFTLDRVLPYLRARLLEGFQGEHAPDGSPWAQLEAATNKIRASEGFPPAHPINERTGIMKRFILDTYDLAGRVGADGDNVLLTLPQEQRNPVTATKILHAQQGGISRAGNPFPARPVIGYGSNDQTVITGFAAAWFARMIASFL